MSLREAHALAARQHGVLTFAQATGTGLTVDRVRRLVDRGHWNRLGVGLFVAGGAPRTYEQEVMAACLATGGVASHGCAARLLGVGVPAFRDARVSVTACRGAATTRARGLGAVVHTSRNLGPQDRGRVKGIPVTRGARLVVDLLGLVAVPVLFALADDVLWRLRDRSEIRRTWERAAGGRYRGRLDQVLLPWVPGPKPGSPKEMSLCRMLLLHGLPRPARQHPLLIPGREHPRYLDLAYPDVRVAMEYDGRRDHGPRHWDADAAREDELAAVGWVRLPAGRFDLVEPHATAYCETVRAVCQRAGIATAVRVAAAAVGRVDDHVRPEGILEARRRWVARGDGRYERPVGVGPGEAELIGPTEQRGARERLHRHARSLPAAAADPIALERGPQPLADHFHAAVVEPLGDVVPDRREVGVRPCP